VKITCTSLGSIVDCLHISDILPLSATVGDAAFLMKKSHVKNFLMESKTTTRYGALVENCQWKGKHIVPFPQKSRQLKANRPLAQK